MLQSFLTQSNQKVHVNGCFSNVIEIKQGVPQATVLGPLFLNIYVNDLNKQLDNTCKMIQYADDSWLIAQFRA